MGQVCGVCGTDMYAKIMKQYGQDFVKLILAQKAKLAVNDYVGITRATMDTFFNNFSQTTNQQIAEQTGFINK